MTNITEIRRLTQIQARNFVKRRKEFRERNDRRHLLIDKKFSAARLTPAEEKELDYLQRWTSALIDKAFPLPNVPAGLIRRLKRLEREAEERATKKKAADSPVQESAAREEGPFQDTATESPSSP